MEAENSTSRKWIVGFDSKLKRMIESGYNLFVLNILFILCCLPVVTVGIAQITLYASVTEWRKNKDINPAKLFIKEIKTHWKIGFKIGIVQLIMGLILIVDLLVLKPYIEPLFFSILANATILLFMMVYLYIYPLSIRTICSIKKLMIQSFLRASINLGCSILLLIIISLIFQLMQTSIIITMMMFSIFLVIGFAIFTYIQSIIVEYVLNK